MGPAQQGRADHRAQVVGVLDAVADDQERRLALGAGGGQQVVHLGVGDLAGKSGHPLVAVGAGQLAQLVGVHPLDRGPRLFGQGRIIRGHRRGHPLGQQHGIHAGAALEQLDDGVFAVHQPLAGLGVPFRFGAAARARSIVLHLFSPPCACRTCGRE